ncbi:hypothetical protein BDN67DRAFT_1017612 [Paxillus ammoniavirescens]|nr:hypothetical protein BDN67DRAFT_1017612 [Paxillus ammoniavirescens]
MGNPLEDIDVVRTQDTHGEDVEMDFSDVDLDEGSQSSKSSSDSSCNTRSDFEDDELDSEWKWQEEEELDEDVVDLSVELLLEELAAESHLWSERELLAARMYISGSTPFVTKLNLHFGR